MRFGNVIFLYLLPFILLGVVLVFTFGSKRRTNLLKTFASERLFAILLKDYNFRLQQSKNFLFCLAIALICLALARPQFGYRLEQRQVKGTDLLFAVDVSKSMLACDVKPNRLERAKIAIKDMTKKLPGHRFGLIAFAGSAFLQCPLTLDYGAFDQSLTILDTNIIQNQGTEVGTAIEIACDVFSKDTSDHILVLFSDGEDLENSALTAAKKAKSNGINIYTVGLGSTEGEFIPILDKAGNQIFLKNKAGNKVKTRLDEETLVAIAKETGGTYHPMSTNGIEELTKTIAAKHSASSGQISEEKVYNEKFQIIIFLAIIVLILELLLKSNNIKNKNRDPIYTRIVSFVVMYLLLYNIASAMASKGEKLYEAGKYAEAAEYYADKIEAQKNNKRVDQRLQFNYGTALLANKQYKEASKIFQEALSPGAKNKLNKEVFYNYGHALGEEARLEEENNLDEAIKLCDESIDCFENALELDENFSDAKDNLDIIKNYQEELKKRKEEQNKKNQNNPNQQQTKDNQDQNQKDDKKDENKNEKDDKNKDDNKDKSDEKKDENKDGKDGKNKDNHRDNADDKKNDDKKNESSNEKDQSDDQKNDQDKQNKDSQQDEKDGKNDHNDESKNEPPNDENRNDNPKDHPSQVRDQSPSDGKMTKKEAAELLNSVRQDEHAMPVTFSDAKIKHTEKFDKFW
ncbi:MAG: VWA domain-containing protein [Puniceicoccales bacterium]|jgi:Ca-activated chloride channel family protein|nr:VWA domain-containing protein [Puniceicoccales bacterium]